MNRDRSKAALLGALTGSMAFDYIHHEVAEQLKQCFCIGPQNGQPVCPCAMRNVKIIDGRYVQIHDLGPVSKGIVSDKNSDDNFEDL